MPDTEKAESDAGREQTPEAGGTPPQSRGKDSAGGRGPDARRGRAWEPMTDARNYPLPDAATDALRVFRSLDNRQKESFLARADMLSLSYRRRTGAGRDDYAVTFPDITLAARSLVENAARYTAGIQRFFDESKFGSLMQTPGMAKMMAQHAALWETASPKHLVDILEAVEFEAAYRSATDRARTNSRDFRDYTPMEEPVDDLEAILAHYTAYRRKHFPYRRERYEFRRYVPGSAPTRPTGQTEGRRRDESARHAARPAVQAEVPQQNVSIHGRLHPPAAETPAASEITQAAPADSTPPAAPAGINLFGD
jgi:hypothetical protein